ncbi:hypothetical protein [Burkholderia vietnamiensis]|uniref:Uncharacterized protein n=1 Tax=Burkholderia vietnamiensis TaxID=60552 RepID=A0AA45BEE7_BURVI|nr:hypothetical protein [Burkholderia vietnamiensis]KVS07784.1 hypothetical protein WK32_09620 [Burkholderia vietnamiensis]PRH42403.1 hypothetical protein C6T65_10180 [Burkholderia vietnamiensis]
MNCKPGDLAYIVRDSGSTALGLVVDVRRRSDRPDGTPCWMVGVPEGCFLECRATGRKINAREFRIPDAWLRPISGVPVTDDVTDEVTA